MDVNAFNVNVCSQQPEKLIEFYRDVVGLPPLPQVSPGAFRTGGAAFLVDGHSEVKGKAKEPQRILPSFSVSDVAAEQERLQAQGVEFVRVATKGAVGWPRRHVLGPRREPLPACRAADRVIELLPAAWSFGPDEAD